MRLRAAVYIDGFNFYHALDDLAQPHLKWLDHSKLARLLVAGSPEDVVRIAFCTAVRTDKPEKLERHRAYLKALRGVGVDVLEGHFSKEDRSCRNCGAGWQHPTEKEGDVSLALAVIDDAYQDVFDVAYLVTADGDQAPTARLLKLRFPAMADRPAKRLVTVAPPGRKHNYKIRDAADTSRAITVLQLEWSLFGGYAPDGAGGLVRRPDTYAPPSGWVHPKDRPKDPKQAKAEPPSLVTEPA